jgi:alkyl hydroperoxide reductase subunit AhpC
VYCTECGDKVDSDSNYCTNCGEQIQGESGDNMHKNNQGDGGKSKIKIIAFFIVGCVIGLLGVNMLIGLQGDEIEYSEMEMKLVDDGKKDSWKVAVIKAKTDDGEYVVNENNKVDTTVTNYTLSGGQSTRFQYPTDYELDFVVGNTAPLGATETAKIEFYKNGTKVDSISVDSIDTATCAVEPEIICSTDS